jgi:hypothetical protein
LKHTSTQPRVGDQARVAGAESLQSGGKHGQTPLCCSAAVAVGVSLAPKMRGGLRKPPQHGDTPPGCRRIPWCRGGSAGTATPRERKPQPESKDSFFFNRDSNYFFQSIVQCPVATKRRAFFSRYASYRGVGGCIVSFFPFKSRHTIFLLGQPTKIK